MSQPFLSQITPVAFNFAPRTYATCSGQLLPIDQNQALYSLLGTTFGGDGRVTFGLPDLRGRTPVHFPMGSKNGQPTHQLQISEMPQHHHIMNCNSDSGTATTGTSAFFAKAPQPVVYHASDSNDKEMASNMIQNYGQSQPHDNMQPYQVILYTIATQGVFPPRN